MKKIVTFILLACMALTLAACTKPDPREEQYAEAHALLERRDYEGAYALFTQLGDYKDAASVAACFRYMPTGHRVEYSDEEGTGTITYTVTLNDQNLPATVVEEYSTGKKHTCTFLHNAFGRVTRRECLDTEGVSTLYEATYDANGKLVSETCTDKDGNVSKFDYTYNEKGELSKIVTTNASDDYCLSYTYTYDAQGREIKVAYENEDETTVEETTYNEAGKILKMTWAVEGGEVYSIYDYNYDEKGRLVEILFTEDGEDGGFRKVTLNDKDQILTEHVYYTFGYEYTNSYEYDEHGNVVKVIYTNPDGEIGNDVTTSAYTLVYLPFEYTEKEWRELCDSTHCWDLTHD